MGMRTVEVTNEAVRSFLVDSVTTRNAFSDQLSRSELVREGRLFTCLPTDVLPERLDEPMFDIGAVSKVDDIFESALNLVASLSVSCRSTDSILVAGDILTDAEAVAADSETFSREQPRFYADGMAYNFAAERGVDTARQTIRNVHANPYGFGFVSCAGSAVDEYEPLSEQQSESIGGGVRWVYAYAYDAMTFVWTEWRD